MAQQTATEQLQGSFLKFIWYVWKHVLLLPPPTRTQLDIAGYLSTGPNRRFIQAFRGVGKTFITGAYVVWRLWKNPDLRVLVVSASEPFALEIAHYIHQIINSPAGEGLWDDLRPRAGQRQSVLSFDVGPAKTDKSPSVKAVGISGQVTGSRADLIISDDVEVANNSDTEGKREKLKLRTTEFAALLKPGGEVVYLGTPQTEQSIYADLPGKGYDVRVWPARYPVAAKQNAYGDFLAPMLRQDLGDDEGLSKPEGSTLGGKPTDPARFNELDLIERETEYGAAGFMLQFMLDTSLSDAERFPLKTRDFIVTDVDPHQGPANLVWSSAPDLALKDLENTGFDGDRLYRPMRISTDWLPYTGTVLAIDPSGTGRDRTAYCVTSFLNGFIYIRAWGGFQDGYSETTLQALADLARDHKVNLVLEETNFGDGMFGKLLEPYLLRTHPVALSGERVSGQKEKRIIDTLGPVLRQHRLVLDASVARQDLEQPHKVHRGLYQLTHLTSARQSLKHDDLVDVLALAVRHWQERLNADAAQAEEDLKLKSREGFLKLFRRPLPGHHRPVPNIKPVRGRGRRSGR